MKKYVTKDGLVSNIADDLAAIQSCFLDNLRNCMGMFIKKPGIKITDTYDFYYIQDSADTVSLTDVGMVVWGDHEISNATGDITINYPLGWTWPAGTTYYAILIKSYDTSEAGTYEAGYSEADDNKFKTITTTAGIYGYAINDNDHITLYKLTKNNAGDIEIEEDYRNNVSLVLYSDMDTATSSVPTNLQVQSIFQKQLLNESTGLWKFVNQVSPHTNTSASRMYLRVTWSGNDPLYEVKLSPQVDGMYALENLDIKRITADNETMIEATEGVEYEVSVRSLDDVYRPSAYCEPINIIAGSDLVLVKPTPPSMSILYNQNPTVLTINVDAVNPPPEPYFVQVFKISATEPAGVALDPQLIYEGSPGTFQHLMMPNEIEAVIKSRVVGPGGVCSEFTVDETGYDGSDYDVLPEDTLIVSYVLHGSFVLLQNASQYNWLMTFRVPTGHRISRALFLSRGSNFSFAGTVFEPLGIGMGTAPADTTEIYTVYVDMTDPAMYCGASVDANAANYIRNYDSGIVTTSTVWNIDNELSCYLISKPDHGGTMTLDGTLILHLEKQ